MSLQDANIKQFPRITKQKALEIAAQKCMSNIAEFKCYSKKPESSRIYGINPVDPCWYVYAPWSNEQNVLRVAESSSFQELPVISFTMALPETRDKNDKGKPN